MASDIGDLLEDIGDEILVEEDHTLNLLPSPCIGKNVSVTEELIMRVLSSIKNDEILPGHLKKSLESISAAQLVPVLGQLDTMVTCVSAEIFSAAAKEKAWHRYHLMQPTLIDDLHKTVPDQQLSAFIVLRTAEELLKAKMAPSASQPTEKSDSDLKSVERDIVAYIAGFVLFRCKRKFISFPEIQNCLHQLTDKDGCTKLISVKSRGGLTQPSSDIVDFFVVLEIEFRKQCTSISVPPLQQFVDTICLKDEAITIFYDCTYHSESKSETQEKLLLTMLSLFHKVRCHAKCRQMMENFYMKTKTASKQKALRKCVD